MSVINKEMNIRSLKYVFDFRNVLSYEISYKTSIVNKYNLNLLSGLDVVTFTNVKVRNQSIS